MNTADVVEDILAHHGVLGMRWGHRSSETSSSSPRSQRRSEAKLAKKDKKFESKASNINTHIALHNATGPAMTKHIEEINKKYAKEIDAGHMLSKDDPINKKYTNEFETHYINELNKQADLMGTNASGTKKYTVMKSDYHPLGFSVIVTDIHHANLESFKIKIIRDSNGAITGLALVKNDLAQSAIDDILAHHGVKGMRWGLRRKATVGPQEVIVSDNRKKLKTSGGAGHPSHSDATSARTSGQIAKKSGVKSLSNKQLEDYNKRVNLEQNFKRLSYHDKPAAQRFALKLLGQTGKQTAQNAANEVASQQVKKALIKAALVAA